MTSARILFAVLLLQLLAACVQAQPVERMPAAKPEAAEALQGDGMREESPGRWVRQ